MDWTPTKKDLSGRLGGEQQTLFLGPSWEAMQVARTWTGRKACCLYECVPRLINQIQSNETITRYYYTKSNRYRIHNTNSNMSRLFRVLKSTEAVCLVSQSALA